MMSETELKDAMYQKLSLYSNELEDRIDNLNKLNTTLTMDNERLTAESTEWESKFYDLQDRINRAVKFINGNDWSIYYEISSCRTRLLQILRGDE